MATSPQQRIENLVENAIGVDHYLDTGEEREILLQSGREGVPVNEAKRIIKQTLDKFSAVNERELVEELEQFLHQYTDNDKYLDRKERADALAAVVPLRPGKHRGLDPKVANEFIDNFCKANSVKQAGESKAGGRKVMGAIIAAAAIIGLIIYFAAISKKQTPTKSKPTSTPVQGTKEPSKEPTSRQKQDIDNLLTEAREYYRNGQYTDPPERSVKSCLDAMLTIDPDKNYRGTERDDLVSKVVDEYIKLAEENSARGNVAGVRQWIGRAKLFIPLFSRCAERINEAERRLLHIESR